MILILILMLDLHKKQQLIRLLNPLRMIFGIFPSPTIHKQLNSQHKILFGRRIPFYLIAPLLLLLLLNRQLLSLQMILSLCFKCLPNHPKLIQTKMIHLANFTLLLLPPLRISQLIFPCKRFQIQMWTFSSVVFQHHRQISRQFSHLLLWRILRKTLKASS